MPQLIYALQFGGATQRVGPDGNVLKIATAAPGCTVESRIAADGLQGSLRLTDGEEARLESVLTFTGATTFQEAGTIVFGLADHRLRFSTVGSGYLALDPEGDSRLGAVIWRVDGGEGQFAGARGLIVSHLVMGEMGEITDHQLGVLYVR